MKELTVVEISETLVRITCEGGRVRDIRNGISFAVVECINDEIKYYEAV